MKYLKLILVLVVLFTPMRAFAQTPQPIQPYENLDSPVDLLASYYNAINLHDYQRAYSYWGNPPLSYAQFSSGFADTASAQLIVQPPTDVGVAAGSAYVAIPTVLVALHLDGTQHVFAGCFITRKSNLSPPAIPEEDVWHLYSADLKAVADATTIPTLLAEACAVG